MPQVTFDQAMQIANEHYQAGRLQHAEQLYRQVLAQFPRHAQAMHHLGLIAHRVGRNDVAVDLIGRAIALEPDRAEAHYHLGIALQETGQTDEAIAAYRRAIALRPDLPEAHGNLGNVLKTKGQHDQAVAAYRQAIALRPSYAEVYNNLGNVLKDMGQLDEAIAAFRRAVTLRPNLAAAHYNLGRALDEKGLLDDGIAAYRQALVLNPNLAEAHSNLGDALKVKGQLDEAIAACRKAIALNPNLAEAYNNLGNALKDSGQLDSAIAAYRQAIAQRPAYAEAHTNLGNTLAGKGLLDEAIAATRQAISLNPTLALAHNNLGNALKDAGRLDEAIAEYRKAASLGPSNADFHGNLVYALHFHAGYDARAIADEYRRWNERHAKGLLKLQLPHRNNADAQRRLKIGYVSPDFRHHPVGRFLLPLLANHDKARFEVLAYSQVCAPDEMTQQFRSRTDGWRNIVGLSDAEVADRIRQDQIDILVDLTMHMADGRLLVFARKPAPVQVTYLAYCSSTGLETMDYRLSDPYLDPIDAARGGPPADNETMLYSEQTIRLPETYWCYPGGPRTAVAPLPAFERGHITFGSLNNFSKVSAANLAAWAKLMRAVPNTQLLLHCLQGSHRQRVLGLLEQQGVDPRRLRFADFQPPKEYFGLYGQIDIALDPFPYGGGTTTCDALWMGVPVVSLVGKTAVGRGGLSILSNIGLPELVARSEEQYVRIASELAGDLPRLRDLRSTLRQRMERSPLMDAPRFARNIEAAYREMWRRWCGGG